MAVYRGLFVFTIVILLLIFNTSVSMTYAGGTSLSFPRQTLPDPSNDVRSYSLSENSICDDLEIFPRIPDMTGVSYFSDGKNLNATIWLSVPFEETPSPRFTRVTLYGMKIGIIQPYNTSIGGDYATFLQWNGLNSTWTRTVQDFLGNDTRTFIQEDIDRISFDNTAKRGKVDLSLDLERIGSPDQFLVLFYMFDGTFERGNACGFVDIVENAAQVPPPEFTLSTFPSPLEIRHGEEKTVELRINSTARNNAIVMLDIPQDSNHVPEGMSIVAEPDETTLTTAGTATTHIKVKVSDKVPPASYSPQINSTFAFPISINTSSLIELLDENLDENQKNSEANFSSSIESEEETFISPINLSPRPTSFSIVVNSYPFDEQFKDFWNTYGGLIGLVGGGFAAGLSALLIDRLKNRSKHRSRKIDDRSDAR